MQRTFVRFLIGVVGLIWLAAVSFAAQYESPPTFSASQVLPPDLLRSPDYRVGNQVGLQNFQYVFNVDT